MTPFVLLTVGCVALFLALHPFTSYPVSLMLIKALRRPVHRSIKPPTAATRFAVCTCAYNEEGVIEAKLQNLLALREQHPSLEILVYVDAASDRTAEICQRYADQITLHASPERHGKTYGMNLLVARTQADILVFTDANVMLDPEVLDKLDGHFADPEIGCVCGNLIYTNSNDSVTARSGSLYWRVEEWIKRLETDTGSVMGADGSLFAIRRSLHQPPPDHIIDDMYVSFMVLCGGHRVVQALDVKAYEETVPAMQEEFRRKVRIACQAFNVHRLLWPRLRQLDALPLYKYLSHKLLRWFTIYLMAVAFLAFLAAALVAGWWVVAGVLAAGALLVWLLGHLFPVQPFSQVFDILTAFAGVGVGVWRSVLGDVYQTWKPATSIRKT